MKAMTVPCLPIVAVLWAVALSPTHAQGTFLALHQGASDPMTEGFNVNGSGSPQVGPVAYDLGVAAWSTKVSAAMVSYHRPFPTIQELDWILEVSMRVVPPDSGPAGSFTAWVTTGQYAFGMYFGLTPDGDPTVTASGGGSLSPQFVLSGAGPSYHDYQLTYSAATETVSLWIDSVKRFDGLAGFQSPTPQDPALRWSASFQSVAEKQANWHLVSLQIIPEPSGLALTLMGAGLLWAARRRASGRSSS